MYTAIHEFAHHIQFTTATSPVSCRAHTNRFWDILHRLLFEAEKKGIYENVFAKDRRFAGLTARIRDEFLAKNGHLMKELGGLLSEARTRNESRELRRLRDRSFGIAWWRKR